MHLLGADNDMLENEWEEDKTDKKIGTKKLRKLEAKAEKRAERQVTSVLNMFQKSNWLS